MTSDTTTRTARRRRPASPALHPRMLLATALVAIVMVPVAFCLAGLGILALDLSGGAGGDTSLVVAIAALLVTDFWGGGAVAGMTKVRARDTAIAWALVHGVLLLLAGLLADRLLVAAPLLAIASAPAAWAGARVARKQLAMRRHIRRAEAARAAREGASRLAVGGGG